MPLFLLLLCTATLWGQQWREAEIGGARIRYQVIDGEAVFQGDIILGPADAFESEVLSKHPGRFASAITGQRFRWTGNTVPYVITDDVPNRSRVTGAIDAWNESTVIRLVPRTTEGNYVEFRRRDPGSCSSNVGMLGGRQFINLPDNCPLGSIIHEIGHTVGLWHTQSRQDRDMFVRVKDTDIDRDSLDQYFQHISDGVDVGAYPYDSIMHYGLGGFALPGALAMETIPSGIPVGQRQGLTASDIDAVALLYGARLQRTIVTTNPPGLDVLVDGRRFQTPVEFDWTSGSTHTLRVEDQTIGATQHRFGRWSDFGQREHQITVTDTKVYTAHLRRFHRLPVSVSPAGSGIIEVSPAPENGVYAEGTIVTLRAQPAEGFQFTNWSGVGFFSSHGSANPIRFGVTSSTLSYTATFTRSTVTTITTDPPRLRINVDGTAYTAPRQFTWTAGTRHTVSVGASTQTLDLDSSQHRFRSWSDGGEEQHEVTASAEGGVITAAFDSSYRLLLSASPTAGGRAFASPGSNGGFLAAGSTVDLSATALSSYRFDGWSGTITSRDSNVSIAVDGEIEARARFVLPGILTAAGSLNGASFLPGAVAPGEIVTLFGLELGPAELVGLNLNAQGRVSTQAGGVRVLFDGVAAPVLYASSRQTAAIAPFAIANRATTLLQVEVNGRLTNSLSLPVAAVSPAFFTFNSSGRGGGAFLNENGSVNTEDNPAQRGSIAVLYATGLGAMQPSIPDGALATAPLPRPVAQVKVFVADRDCEILYAGPAPGLVAGLYQINVRLPATIDPGVVPVVVEAAGIRSPRTVSLAVF